MLLGTHLRYQGRARDLQGVRDSGWKGGENAVDVNATFTREQPLEPRRMDEALIGGWHSGRRIAHVGEVEPLGGQLAKVGHA